MVKHNQFSKNHYWSHVIFIIIVVLGLVYYIYSHHWPQVTVRYQQQSFRLLLADTRPHQILGLSDRAKLSNLDGMLFLFLDPGRHAMVMRRMNFSLDMIWLKVDQSNCERGFSLRSFFFPPVLPCRATVVDIAPQIAPEIGYNDNQLTPYFSRVNSQLVWEASAGLASKIGLKIGDQVDISW